QLVYADTAGVKQGFGRDGTASVDLLDACGVRINKLPARHAVKQFETADQAVLVELEQRAGASRVVCDFIEAQRFPVRRARVPEVKQASGEDNVGKRGPRPALEAEQVRPGMLQKVQLKQRRV